MKICIGAVKTHYSKKVRTIKELAVDSGKSVDWAKCTGIKQVHVVDDGIITSEEATIVADELLKDANVNPKEIDQLVYISEGMGDYLYMDTSKTIIRNIGGRTDGVIYTYDICRGSNGTIGAIKFAGNQLISNKSISKTIIDTSLLWENHSNKRVLGETFLGDAAGAVLLQADLGHNEILSTSLESMSEYNMVAGFKYGGTKFDLPKEELRKGKFYYGILDENHLKGVLDNVVETAIRVGKDAILKAKISLNDIDYLGISGFHKDYNDAIMRAFEGDARVIDPLEEKGYIGTAGVMEILNRFLNDDSIESGSNIVIISFGIDINVEAMVVQK